MRYLTAAGPMMRRRLKPPPIPEPRPAEQVKFGAHPACLADVYVPDALEPEAPSVLIVHGGGFVFGSRAMSSVRVVGQELLDTGHVVASIDYRLARVVSGARLEEQEADVRAAATWWSESAASYGARPGLDALMGLSAGGALALYAADEVDARRFIGVYGAYDLDLLPVSWFTASTLVRSTRRQVREARSPLRHGGFSAPALLVHGTADPLAVPEHTTRLAELRQAASLETQTVLIEGAVHGFLQDGADHPHSRRLLQAMHDFLERTGG